MLLWNGELINSWLEVLLLILSLCRSIVEMGSSSLSKHSKETVVKNDERNLSKIILIEEKVQNLVSCSNSTKSQKKFQVNRKSVGLDDYARVFIKRSLMRSGVFSNEVNHSKITSDDINEIVNAFEVKVYSDHEFLFYKDDFPCDEMFIPRKGQFRGWKDSKCKVIMKEGDLIGDLGFFHENPRLLSVTADGDQPSAYRLLKRDYKVIVEKGRNIRNIKILNTLSESQKLVFRERISLANFFRGDVILRRGAPITHFFLIISGLVRVQGNDENSSEASCLFPGDYFGEGRFLSGCKDSPKTYACMKDVSLCLIPEKLFEDVKEFGKVQEQIISDRAIKKEANSRTGRRKRSISIGKPTPEILDKHETNPNPTAFCFLLDFFP